MESQKVKVMHNLYEDGWIEIRHPKEKKLMLWNLRTGTQKVLEEPAKKYWQEMLANRAVSFELDEIVYVFGEAHDVRNACRDRIKAEQKDADIFVLHSPVVFALCHGLISDKIKKSVVEKLAKLYKGSYRKEKAEFF